MNLSEAASVASIAAITSGGVMFIQRLIMGNAIGNAMKDHNDDKSAHSVIVVGRRHCDMVHGELLKMLESIRESIGDIGGDMKVVQSNIKILMKKTGLNGDS